MKQATQTIDLWNAVLKTFDVGMYNSILAPDFEMLQYNLDEDGKSEEEIEKIIDTFDGEKYNNVVLECVTPHLEDFLVKVNQLLPDQFKMIKVDGKYAFNVYIQSPKFYNFQTDELCHSVDVSDDIADKMIQYVQDMIDSNDTKFEKYLADVNKSYDGFHSFEPTNYFDFIREVNDSSKIGHAYGHLVSFLIKDEFDDDDYQEMFDDFYEDFQGNHGAVDESVVY